MDIKIWYSTFAPAFSDKYEFFKILFEDFSGIRERDKWKKEFPGKKLKYFISKGGEKVLSLSTLYEGNLKVRKRATEASVTVATSSLNI